MINHFFPFLVSSAILTGSTSPITVRSTDAASEISNHSKGGR